MNSSPHLKRAPPERSGPIRTPLGTRPRPEPGAQANPASSAGAAVIGALENGVRTAYSVIDEYIRRGQEAAGNIFNNPSRRGTMSDERGNFGGGFNPWNPLAFATEQWIMAMRMWSQAWSAYIPGAFQQGGFSPFSFGGMQTPAVKVEVASSGPVEVALNLYAASSSAELMSEPLRAEGFTAQPIDAASVGREPGAVRVNVRVTAGQPAGRYRGLIRNETDKSVAGELTVVVS
jgi:hypothetical protein